MNLTKNIELTNQKMCKIDLGNSDFIGTSVWGVQYTMENSLYPSFKYISDL